MSPTPQLPRLIVITDWSLGDEALLRAVRAVVALGPTVGIQHRNRDAEGRRFLQQARALAELCRAARVPLFVNGRLDVALLVNAHLHLPSSGPSAAEVRPLLAPGRWISAAVHDEAEAARAKGADLALVSPVFGAGSKANDTRPRLGAQGFSALARRLSCPAYALGAVEPETAVLLPRDETAGVATISSVLKTSDPAAAAKALLDALS